jgi:hypothetical protein
MVKKIVTSTKYKRGDKVYSYQNKTKAGEILFVEESKDPEYPHSYKLILPDGSLSNWISENSIAKTKNAKNLK